MSIFKMHSNLRRLAAACAIIVLGCLSVAPGMGLSMAHAAGATLSLTPASGSYAAGGTFTVSVALDSGGGVGVNAADGTITFDSTMLAVQSISKDSSVFNLWTSDPSFSNAAGP